MELNEIKYERYAYTKCRNIRMIGHNIIQQACLMNNNREISRLWSGTILYSSKYYIPESVDLNVLRNFRSRGLSAH